MYFFFNLNNPIQFSSVFGLFHDSILVDFGKKAREKTQGNGFEMTLESRETNEKRQNENWGNKQHSYTQIQHKATKQHLIRMKSLALAKQEQ